MNETPDRYPHRSAAHHLGPPVPTFGPEETAGAVLEKLKQNLGVWNESQLVYVLDRGKKLLGVVSTKQISQAQGQMRLEELTTKDVITVTSHAHQNHVAKLAVQKDLSAIPVLDKNGIFLGVIDPKQILKILHEEHIENLMRFSGILSSESIIDVFKASVGQLFKARVPWLLLGLVGGMFATTIVSFFEPALKEELALAFFIPVIVYINAAVGAQTQTLFVRGIALEKVNFKKYLWQELKISFLIGLVVALIMGVFAMIWVQNTDVAFIVGSAILIGVLSSVFVATLIPWLLKKFGKDPAVGSGPFSTVVQDILSLTIYFTVASMLLF